MTDEHGQFPAGVLDVVEAMYAIVNADGCITATNRSWRTNLPRMGYPAALCNVDGDARLLAGNLIAGGIDNAELALDLGERALQGSEYPLSVVVSQSNDVERTAFEITFHHLEGGNLLITVWDSPVATMAERTGEPYGPASPHSMYDVNRWTEHVAANLARLPKLGSFVIVMVELVGFDEVLEVVGPNAAYKMLWKLFVRLDRLAGEQGFGVRTSNSSFAFGISGVTETTSEIESLFESVLGAEIMAGEAAVTFRAAVAAGANVADFEVPEALLKRVRLRLGDRLQDLEVTPPTIRHVAGPAGGVC